MTEPDDKAHDQAGGSADGGKDREVSYSRGRSVPISPAPLTEEQRRELAKRLEEEFADGEDVDIAEEDENDMYYPNL